MNPPDLADVLAEVNRLRAERGMAALEEMPKGEQRNALECPMKHALNACSCSPWFAHVGFGEMIDLPPVITRFITAFDHGAYPELQA